MTPEHQQEALAKLRRRLCFLRERLKDVRGDPALSPSLRQEKVTYYTTAIAKARAGLLSLEGH